ncbi:hypothetical protein KM043_005890 [Ampulex compressa]|nr:hypothetical protein KM043_005890 [Ampulex compressa]
MEENGPMEEVEKKMAVKGGRLSAYLPGRQEVQCRMAFYRSGPLEAKFPWKLPVKVGGPPRGLRERAPDLSPRICESPNSGLAPFAKPRTSEVFLPLPSSDSSSRRFHWAQPIFPTLLVITGIAKEDELSARLSCFE